MYEGVRVGLGYEITILSCLVHELGALIEGNCHQHYLSISRISVYLGPIGTTILPKMAILKPSRLGHPARRQPDLRATSPTQPAIQFNDRLNDFTSAILHSILRQ